VERKNNADITSIYFLNALQSNRNFLMASSPKWINMLVKPMVSFPAKN